MIFVDLTKTHTGKHYSGLHRFSMMLLTGLRKKEACGVVWKARRGLFSDFTSGAQVEISTDDIFITAELFSEKERPGMLDYLAKSGCFKVAVFHDAIPLLHPEWTWPKSVQRHPFYMKLLRRFDRVLAVSTCSANDLDVYWDWLGQERKPEIRVVPSGADMFSQERIIDVDPARSERSDLLAVGILEPRKNQESILDACLRLWSDGYDFRLNLVGRCNPHFGKDILSRIKGLIRKGYPLNYLKKASDEIIRNLYLKTRVSIFPSLAEGNGLPVLESLWMGVPVISTPVPAALEWAKGKGILELEDASAQSIYKELKRSFSDTEYMRVKYREILEAPLLSWKEAAEHIFQELLA